MARSASGRLEAKGHAQWGATENVRFFFVWESRCAQEDNNQPRPQAFQPFVFAKLFQAQDINNRGAGFFANWNRVAIKVASVCTLGLHSTLWFALLCFDRDRAANRHGRWNEYV